MNKDEELKALRAKTEAVRKLMNLDSLNITDVDLNRVKKLEEQASMNPMQKLQAIADDNTPYKEDKLQQHFSAIKAITHLNGFILIKVDEHNSRRAATEKAIRVLGLNAPVTTFNEYVANHTHHDTVMSVKSFVKRLRNLSLMVAMHPELFGSGRGGGNVGELFKEAKAAINEARKWLIKNRVDWLKDERIREELVSPDFMISEKTSIDNLLGKGWEKASVENADIIKAAKMLGEKLK